MTNRPANLPTHLQHHIGGTAVDSIGGETFEVIDPVTNEPYATAAAGQQADVDAAVAAATLAFEEGPWPRMKARERARILMRIADVVASRDDELSQYESFDSGLPITQAKGASTWQTAKLRMPRMSTVVACGWSGGGPLGRRRCHRDSVTNCRGAPARARSLRRAP